MPVQYTTSFATHFLKNSGDRPPLQGQPIYWCSIPSTPKNYNRLTQKNSTKNSNNSCFRWVQNEV
ncbi:hypothetical protein Hanom_Chr04g00315071 [Helianthus anomalus]